MRSEMLVHGRLTPSRTRVMMDVSPRRERPSLLMESHPAALFTQRLMYTTHRPLMEPWDGAGCHCLHRRGGAIGATLDRNGLRPRALHRHR